MTELLNSRESVEMSVSDLVCCNTIAATKTSNCLLMSVIIVPAQKFVRAASDAPKSALLIDNYQLGMRIYSFNSSSSFCSWCVCKQNQVPGVAQYVIVSNTSEALTFFCIPETSIERVLLEVQECFAKSEEEVIPLLAVQQLRKHCSRAHL